MSNCAAAGEQDGNRMRQLDGLRGLAIIGVFMNHFGQFSWSVSCGWMGVSLFFVLSGFLITRILLMQKSVMSGAGGGLWRTLGIFYARRSLRIFPLYYGIVVIACYWNLNQAGSVKWPLATYTYNMVLASDNNIGPGHLWSLCVEEQFYLVWPALILLCPPRILPWMIATVFIMGPLWRLWCFIAGTSRMPMYYSSFACLDCLAAGSFLAWCEFKGPTVWNRFITISRPLGWTLMLVWAIACIKAPPLLWGKVGIEWLVGNMAMAIFFAYAVGKATQPLPGDYGAVLRMRWLGYLGTISYGVYVLHMFTPVLWNQARHWLPWVTIPSAYACVFLSIAGGAFTWHFFEKPIQSLKRFLPYTTTPKSLDTPTPIPLKQAA